MRIKVLMFGWEFPPYNVGGLGVACHGLVKSMARKGMDVTFVMPKAPMDAKSDFAQLMVADRLSGDFDFDRFGRFTPLMINSLISPYMNEADYQELLRKMKDPKFRASLLEASAGGGDFILDDQYGENLYLEIERFTAKAGMIAQEKKDEFDIIHCHDWMTFGAGKLASEVSGKPFVAHIHNTAFDRSGGNPNPLELAREKEGFEAADKVIAISNYVKNSIVKNYEIKEDKVEVAHNGIDIEDYSFKMTPSYLDKKVVLYAGRVTLQKGPEYFVMAAEEVCKKREDVLFVMAGSGDMLSRMVDLVASKGLSDRFVFTGRYNKEEGQRLMNMADIFVMPSVSEPFGLVPLEAMLQKTPTIISRQSGVSEVVENSLKVDFWDTHELANKILAVLKYQALSGQLAEFGEREAKAMSWDKAAEKCNNVFYDLIFKNCQKSKLSLAG